MFNRDINTFVAQGLPVYATRDWHPHGHCSLDVVTLETDVQPGEPLLIPVMRGGRRVSTAPALADIRCHAADSLARLPEPLRSMHESFEYPVEIAAAVRELAVQVDRHRIFLPEYLS